jgi:NitT/TauT family transport system substrate-binding protein
LRPLTVAIPPLEQNALLYVAEARHLFEDNGLQVTFQDYDSSVATMDALLQGKANIAGLSEFPFIKPALQGEPVCIIAVTDHFENAYLLIRRDRGIAAWPDLAGKTIGVIRGTILEFYLGRFLQLNGLDLQDVAIVDTKNTARTTAAIVEGDVDAVVAFQPHVSDIQAQMSSGVTTWAVQNDQLVYGILVADDDWLGQNRDTVQRFLQSLAEAEEYLLTHPDEARAIVQEKLGLEGEYLAGTWSLHEFSLSLDVSLVIALNDEARWQIDNGLVAEAAMPNFTDYIYLEGLAAVKPEAVNISR